jgi:hypothetical protein
MIKKLVRKEKRDATELLDLYFYSSGFNDRARLRYHTIERTLGM